MRRGLFQHNCSGVLLRRLTFLAFILVLVFCVTACNSKPVEIVEPPTIPVTDNAKEPNPPVKATSETPITDTKPTSPVEVEVTAEAMFNSIPNVDGLTKKIIDDQIIYVADEGNPYNLESGVYAGFYKENVEVEGVKTGGICLLPEVVLDLIKRDTSKVIVPVGVENNDENAPLFLSNASKEGVSITFILIKAEAAMEIIGSCPTSDPELYLVSNSSATAKDFYSTTEGRFDLTALSLLPKYMIENSITAVTRSFFIVSYLCDSNVKPASNLKADFGSLMYCEDGVTIVTSNPVMIYTGDKSGAISITTQDLLMIDDKPVFINTIQNSDR